MSSGPSVKGTIGADSTPLKRELNSAQQAVAKFKNSVDKSFTPMGERFKSAFVPFSAGLAVVGTLGFSIKRFADYCGDAVDKSLRFNESVETIQKVDVAAQQAGSSVEQVGKVLSGMALAAKAAAEGNREQAESFADVGISARQFMGMKMEGRLAALADAYERCNSDQDKMAKLLDLCGNKGSAIFPMLAGGAEDFRAKLAEIPTVTEEVAYAMDELGDKVDELKQTLTSWTGAGVGFLQNVATRAGELMYGNADLSLPSDERIKKEKKAKQAAAMGDDLPDKPGKKTKEQIEAERAAETARRAREDYANQWEENNAKLLGGMQQGAESYSDYSQLSGQERGNISRERRAQGRADRRAKRRYGIGENGIPENASQAQKLLRDQKRGRVPELSAENQAMVEQMAREGSVAPPPMDDAAMNNFGSDEKAAAAGRPDPKESGNAKDNQVLNDIKSELVTLNSKVGNLETKIEIAK